MTEKQMTAGKTEKQTSEARTGKQSNADRMVKQTNACMYCEKEDARRLALMVPVVKLNTAILHLYREQSYPGRCVLVYDRHVQKLTDLTAEEHAAFFRDVQHAAQVLTKLYHPDKINYLVLGDLCPHLHLHLVPKYQGGTDWGSIFQMMPNPAYFLSGEEEAAEVERIRRAFEG